MAVFFACWAAIGLAFSSTPPWWWRRHRQPEYFDSVGFRTALSRLQDQPFCLPQVALVQRSDVSSSVFAPGACDDEGSGSWRCSMLRWTNKAFDQLEGSTVSALASMATGQPFYHRTTRTRNSTTLFRSAALYRLVDDLAHTATLPREEVLREFNLTNTTVHNEELVLETTLSDTHKLAQTLVALYHGLAPSSPGSVLGGAVRDLLQPTTMSSDGSTARTRSGFDMVRKGLARAGASALNYIGRDAGKVPTRLQHLARPLDLHILTESQMQHHLAIAINLEARGLVVTALVLHPSCAKQGEERGQSVWEWTQQTASDMVYQLDSPMEERLLRQLGGTYRFASADEMEWMEVDVQVDERVLWITRIEYASQTHLSSSTAQMPLSTTSTSNTSNSNGSRVSVLQKYNVGGTADFFAGWTCQPDDLRLASCYRPHVGSDETGCYCRAWRQDAFVTHRVGLWPYTNATTRRTMYRIPPAAIRRDGASYMDQPSGGCPALGRPDPTQATQEMQRLGYTLALTEPVYSAQDGKVHKEARLTWIESGVEMHRVKPLELRW